MRVPRIRFRRSNRVPVGRIDRFQRQRLIDLTALRVFVASNQLDLGVGEAVGSQGGQHLMAEQVRVRIGCDGPAFPR